MPLLADFGTSWTKLLDTASGERRIEKTKDLGQLKADLATGHNANGRAGRSRDWGERLPMTKPIPTSPSSK